MHNNSSTTLPPKPKTLKTKINRRTRRRRRNHKPNQILTHQFTHNINPKGFDLWRKTYENILSWQNQHQVNYWKNQAQNFRKINQELWTKLQIYENKQLHETIVNEEKEVPEYETSSEEDDDTSEKNGNKTEIDEEYLKFLEITHKHQNDRNLLRDKTENKALLE